MESDFLAVVQSKIRKKIRGQSHLADERINNYLQHMNDFVENDVRDAVIATLLQQPENKVSDPCQP